MPGPCWPRPHLRPTSLCLNPVRCQSLLNEVRMAAGRVLLFIDELHILMDAGRVEGGMNAGERRPPRQAPTACSRYLALAAAAVANRVCCVVASWPGAIAGSRACTPPAYASRAGLLKPAKARPPALCLEAAPARLPSRGPWPRSQPAEAGAGPRRAALHRGHHGGGVPSAHRAGRRVCAALPGGPSAPQQPGAVHAMQTGLLNWRRPGRALR